MIGMIDSCEEVGRQIPFDLLTFSHPRPFFKFSKIETFLFHGHIVFPAQLTPRNKYQVSTSRVLRRSK